MLRESTAPNTVRTCSHNIYCIFSEHSGRCPRTVCALLGGELEVKVYGGDGILEHLPTENAKIITDLPLITVLMDMWTCVRSEMFTGRMGSSLSWNVMYWRQVLQEEFGLDQQDVQPVWYLLQDFSTTGAKRAEGKLPRRPSGSM